jgi:PKD repeat protein
MPIASPSTGIIVGGSGRPVSLHASCGRRFFAGRFAAIALLAALVLVAVLSMAGQAGATCSFSSNVTSGISPLTVQYNDTTIRVTGSPAVKYYITIDPDLQTNDTNRANNIRASTYSYMPIYNGYAGKRYMDGGSDVDTVRTYDLRGGFLHSFGDSQYVSGSFGTTSWTGYYVNWTPADLSLPAGATVADAWLYVPYCWDNTNVAPDNTRVTFNGVIVPYVNWYHDQSNSGAYPNYVYGLMTYNVTTLFVNGTTNQVYFQRLCDSSAKISTAGFTLLVVYKDANASRKHIFVNEEFDALGASLTSSAYGTNETEATAYVPFTGMTIEAGSVTRANLTTFVPWGAGWDVYPGEGNLFFNGNKVGSYVWNYGPRAVGASDNPQVGVDTRDVKAYILSSGNVAAVQSQDLGGTPLIVAAQDFLVVEYPDAFPGKSLMPSDPDQDGRFEDLNGNERLDFEDVVTYFQNMGWIRGNVAVGIAIYDFNGNGVIDFADLVALFDKRLA